ncbi:MAG TPA: bacteriophage holin [Alphaproteobacteria bacterium]|nr:bacteriophage holin [Alphaproteobacteria bacterium]
MNKCQPLALGVAIGVVWALYVLGAGLCAMWGWGVDLVNVLGSLYVGYKASIPGAIIGGVWAFADGFVAGVVIAWVYNKVAKPS